MCPLPSDVSVATEPTARADATRLALLFGVALSLLVVLADVQVKAAVESRSANSLAAAACVYVVLGSLMVSYTRARAEALGVECTVGLATRPVRVVILSIGILFAGGFGSGNFELLAPAIYVMAALTTVTVIQRVWHVRRALILEG